MSDSESSFYYSFTTAIASGFNALLSSQSSLPPLENQEKSKAPEYPKNLPVLNLDGETLQALLERDFPLPQKSVILRGGKRGSTPRHSPAVSK